MKAAFRLRATRQGYVPYGGGPMWRNMSTEQREVFLKQYPTRMDLRVDDPQSPHAAPPKRLPSPSSQAPKWRPGIERRLKDD